MREFHSPFYRYQLISDDIDIRNEGFDNIGISDIFWKKKSISGITPNKSKHDHNCCVCVNPSKSSV